MKAIKNVGWFLLFILLWFVSLLCSCNQTELEDWQKQVASEQMIR